VRKFELPEQVREWLNKVDETKLGMYLWQKCLPTRWDLRIIVLGGKAIGAMKRSAKQDEFRSNYSLGGSVEVWDLGDNDKQLAEKVAKVCGLDYCGVDIMKDDEGNSYILEVNRQCQFKGFEESTQINVAKLVVELLRR
jgi:RimK family alpha-L-glutamate ligase